MRTVCYTLVFFLTACAANAEREIPLRQTPQNQPNKESSLHYLLLAEIALRKGDYANAYSLYRHLSNTTNNPQAYAIAYAISVKTQDTNQQKTSAEAWHMRYPKSKGARQALAITYMRYGEINALIHYLAQLEEQQGIVEDATFLEALHQVSLANQKKALAQLANKHTLQPREVLWQRVIQGAIAQQLITNGAFAQAHQLLTQATKDVLKTGEHKPSLVGIKNTVDEHLLLLLWRAELLAHASVDIKKFTHLQEQIPHFYRLQYYLAQYHTLFITPDSLKKARVLLLSLLNKKQAPTDIKAQALQLAASTKIKINLPFWLNSLYPKDTIEKTATQAILWQHQYKPKAALRLIKKSYEKTQNSQLLVPLMELYKRVKNPRTAQRIVERLPIQNDAENYLLRANMLHTAGAYAQSNKVLESWLSTQWQQYDSHQKKTQQTTLQKIQLSRANNYFFLNKLDTTHRILSKQLEIFPENAQLLNALGFMLADSNKHLVKAKKLITQSLALDPSNAAIIDSMGWINYRLGHYQQATVDLLRAYQLIPSEETAYHLAMAYWQIGKKNKTKQLLRRILRTHARSPYLLQALTQTRLQARMLRIR